MKRAGKTLQFDKGTLFRGGILTLLLGALFYPTYYHLHGRFSSADSYYSHGYLVPIVSIVLVWMKREVLSRTRVSSHKGGLFLLVAGIFLYLVSTQLKVNFGTYMAMIVIIAGVILYLLGGAVFKELLFPIGFLFFMMPLPRVVIIGISFKMKIMAAQLSTFVVNLMGIEAVRQGSTIFFGGESLIVGDPCSGLRSLISFFALGFLFIQFVDARRFKKCVMVLSTFPVAILSNMVRLVLLVLATHIYGSEFALGFFHDFTGFIVFVVGGVFLYSISKVLGCHFSADNI